MTAPTAGPPGKLHFFFSAGSCWFGIAAWLLELTALSSHYLGWKNVNADGTTVSRIEVTITSEQESGTIRTARAILWPGVAVAGLGVLVGLLSLLFRPRKSGWLIIGLCLNLIALVGPFLFPARTFS